jgi:ribose-phosphate pyrophosphokinase
VTDVAVHSLPPSARDAARLAGLLDIAMHEIDVHQFPDGEMRVTVGPAAATTIVYATLDRPNEKLIALLFAVEALRRGGAQRLVLVAPYLCYMRQDAAFRMGEAISQKAVGHLLAGLFDRIVTVDAHLHRTRDIRDVFPGIAADNLSAMPTIADTLRAVIDRRTVVVGPDIESRLWVGDLARRLGLDCAVAQKIRHDDRLVELKFEEPHVLSGRPALVVDDIVSSGGTLKACAAALKAAGAHPIDVVITHALFPAELYDEFLAAGIRSIRSTSSVPHPTNAVVLDAVLAEALRVEMDDPPGKPS